MTCKYCEQYEKEWNEWQAKEEEMMCHHSEVRLKMRTGTTAYFSVTAVQNAERERLKSQFPRPPKCLVDGLHDDELEETNG